MRKSAILSDCGAYRYELRRTWDDQLPVLLWIGLNPSTADHLQDDPTNRRIAVSLDVGATAAMCSLTCSPTDHLTPKHLSKREIQ